VELRQGISAVPIWKNREYKQTDPIQRLDEQRLVKAGQDTVNKMTQKDRMLHEDDIFLGYSAV
jgi:hypothetical protein